MPAPTIRLIPSMQVTSEPGALNLELPFGVTSKRIIKLIDSGLGAVRVNRPSGSGIGYDDGRGTKQYLFVCLFVR